MKALVLVVCFFSLACTSALGQEHHNNLPRKRIAFYIGHTLIPELSSDKNVLIPSYGLDIDYWFSDAFGLGIHSDIEIENFVVNKNESEEIERQFPLVLTLDALYSPIDGLIIQAGPGVELDPGKRFLLSRVGVEYEIPIGHHWDLSPAIFYDHRFNSFGTWTLSLGVGKRF